MGTASACARAVAAVSRRTNGLGFPGRKGWAGGMCSNGHRNDYGTNCPRSNGRDEKVSRDGQLATYQDALFLQGIFWRAARRQPARKEHGGLTPRRSSAIVQQTLESAGRDSRSLLL